MADWQELPLPFCRDCGQHVRLTAFAGDDDFSCSVCEGGNWYWDNAPPPGVMLAEHDDTGEQS